MTFQPVYCIAAAVCHPNSRSGKGEFGRIVAYSGPALKRTVAGLEFGDRAYPIGYPNMGAIKSDTGWRFFLPERCLAERRR
jgi:hypothetical protein